MNGIKVQINDYKVDNSFDMIKTTLKLITLCKDLSLSDTELYTLTYFVINGLSTLTKEDLITTKIVKSKGGVYNIITKFRNMGIIKKEKHKEVLASEYLIPSKDINAIKLEVIIKN